MSTASLAANAYASVARNLSGGAAPRVLRDVQATPGAGGSFANMLQSALTDTLATSRAGEAKAQALIAGKADLVDVVTAVAETEVAVESLVSIRDKVIQAYQEIMQMPI